MDTEQQAAKTPLVTVDQEAWIKKCLWFLVDRARSARIDANSGMLQSIADEAIAGAVNGTAIEIIRLFGMLPCYVNIQKNTRNLKTEEGQIRPAPGHKDVGAKEQEARND